MIDLLKKAMALLFCCIMLFPQIVQAKQTELVVLDRTQDITIVLSFDVEEPDVTIIAPSGKKYSADSDYDAVERTDISLYLYISDAEAGNWTIDYDKKKNTELEATVLPWYHELSINNVSVTSVEEGRLTGTADIICDSDTYYNYYLYAVTLDSNGSVNGKKEIGSGSGYSNSELNFSASTAQLVDGDYYLQLEAYITTDSGTELPSLFLTDKSFSVSGNTLPVDNAGIISILDLTESTLYLDWSSIENSVERWVLGLFLKDSSDPVYYTEFGVDETADSIILDEEEGDVRIELTGYTSDGKYIRFDRNIVWNSDVVVEFETPEITNSLQGAIRYDTAGKKLRAVLYINDKSEQLQLSDSGIVSLGLDEMEVNEVTLQYGWEDNNYYRISQRIAVDSIPPTLDLFGLPDQITVTEKSFPVSGKTEQGAVLTVNAQEYEIEADGNFIIELTLQKGKNILVFEASDKVDNKTSRTLIVYYSPSGNVVSDKGNSEKDIPWIGLMTFIGSLISLLFMGLFGSISASACRKEGMVKGSFKRKSIAVLEGLCCSVVLLAGILTGIFAFLYVRFSEIVSGENLPGTLQNYSTAEIASMINSSVKYRNYAIITGVLVAVGIIVFVLLLVVGHKVKQKYGSLSQNTAD